MTVSTMLVFCLIVAGEFVNCLYWSIILAIVMCIWSFYFSEGTSCMPKYTHVRFVVG